MAARSRRAGPHGPAGLAALLLLLGPAACDRPEPALARGDRLWADSAYADALAEYRLALRRNGDEDVRLRVAHAYALTGQVERARDAYERLLARAPEYTDQAVYDFAVLARRAYQRGDRYGMARAVELATALRPELTFPELAEPLGQYYAENAESEQALIFYERALAQAPPDSVADILYALGQIHEGRGNCREAVAYFEAHRRQAPRGPRAGEARWHQGNCAFQLARDARQEGRLQVALEQLGTVLRLGVPENLQDQAWFERGEILLSLGRSDEALEAYRRVLELNPERTGQLVERARRRIDQIRFGL